MKVPGPDTGLGILVCQACGEPLRHHRIAQPCPAMRGERITVGRIRGHGDPNSPDAIRRRASRAKR